MKSYYITTTLPYVNATPHVGFAMEIIRADALARAKMKQGYDVFFNTGTDEHGQKLFTAAEKEGIPVQEYVDRYAQTFKGLLSLLDITQKVTFIRTTDEHHVAAAQAFWKRVQERGYIYKKNYESKYCVGCELEKTDSELNEAGRCPIHPNLDIELINEENYFFAYSKLEKELQDFYDKTPDFVIPDFRFNEMKAFLSRGLQDFSISRLASKMSWGVPVPGDEDHVMYVWFDALTNYISTLGWPEDEAAFTKYWAEGTPVQYCGKDNTRQQSSMWQAMLIAAGLPNSRHIIVNGFINSGGQKMSKSLGNVLNPYDVIEAFAPMAGDLSPDVLRYYLLRHMNSFEDSDMTMESIKEAYQASLANGLGNLVSRIMTLSEKYCDPRSTIESDTNLPVIVARAVEAFDLQKAMNAIWDTVGELDAKIADTKPFSVVKIDPEKGKEMIRSLVEQLFVIASELAPFMPKTSAAILSLIAANKKPEVPLFNRLA